MAFLTRRDDILSTEMRLRICDGQYIMGTVTVVTLRRFRVSELRHFAVIRIEIRFRNRLVTTTALLHDLQFEPVLISSPDRVRRVAIIAHRKLFVCLSHKCGMDAALKLLFDTMMAAAAGLRNILPVHARQGIGFRVHAVRSMTACARGGDRQTALH